MALILECCRTIFRSFLSRKFEFCDLFGYFDLERNSHKIDIKKKKKFFLKKLFCLFPFSAWFKFWMRSLRLDSNKFQFRTFFPSLSGPKLKTLHLLKKFNCEVFQSYRKEIRSLWRKENVLHSFHLSSPNFYSLGYYRSIHSGTDVWFFFAMGFSSGKLFLRSEPSPIFISDKKSKNKLLCPNERACFGVSRKKSNKILDFSELVEIFFRR